jgi:hypothetical protein
MPGTAPSLACLGSSQKACPLSQRPLTATLTSRIGIAEAAVQAAEAESLFTPALFGTSALTAAGDVASIVSKMTSLVLDFAPHGHSPSTSLPADAPPASTAGAVHPVPPTNAPHAAAAGASASPPTHALQLLARVAKDPAFAPHAVGLPVREGEHEGAVDRVVRVGGAHLEAYLAEWFGGVRPERNVLRAKYEEVAWMNTVVYAIGGWAGRAAGSDEKGKFNGDFFLCAVFFCLAMS